MQGKSLWLGALALAFTMGVAAPADAGIFKRKPKGDESAEGEPKARPDWMNEQGEVTNSSKVEAGYGETVKGRNDYEGEITGKPFPGSKFIQLEIGMPMKQVTDLVGQPTDQGAYVTGKAFIPFFFGGDQYRHELAYKGQGRLVFAGESMGTNGHLIWIIYNKDDSGYRE